MHEIVSSPIKLKVSIVGELAGQGEERRQADAWCTGSK